MNIELSGRLLREQALRALEAWIEGLIDLEAALGNDLERPCRLKRDYRRPLAHRDAGDADRAPKPGPIAIEIGQSISFPHGAEGTP